MRSNLDLANETDNFPYPDPTSDKEQRFLSSLWTLVWKDSEGPYPIGYVPDHVVQELRQTPVEVRGEMDVDEVQRTLQLFHQYSTEEARTSRGAELASYWREKKTFKILSRWRGEPWPVFGRKGELLFSFERSAIGLLGAMRYGVHLTAYVKDESAPHGFKLWIPRRAMNKSSWPGMLDNTVAGGLMTGEDPWECIIREADEEASLPEQVVRGSAQAVGALTYVYVTEEQHVGQEGLVYPEVEWAYDLELPRDVIPEPKDGEAEDFQLYDFDQLRVALGEGQFKGNCSLVILDFMIRRGILTDKDDPALKTVEEKIHRKMPFPGPHEESWPGTWTLHEKQ